jgi:hypothetical protein
MNDSASKGQMCLFYCNNLERLPLRGKRHLQSKEVKVMVMVDIFWYLTLVVGSELPLLVKQSVHNCTWIEHGSGPGIAYYHFNNLARLKYC